MSSHGVVCPSQILEKGILSAIFDLGVTLGNAGATPGGDHTSNNLAAMMRNASAVKER